MSNVHGCLFALEDERQHGAKHVAAADMGPARGANMSLLPTRQLAVFTVFFGPLPPWLPLTLQSMAFNPGVTFIVIGDAAPPALLPPNVHFETVSYPAMQARLSRMLTPGNSSSVRYSFTYKANDIKPFAAHLYPELLGRHPWWAWADLDVIFGDLLKHLTPTLTQTLTLTRQPLRRRRDRGRQNPNHIPSPSPDPTPKPIPNP